MTPEAAALALLAAAGLGQQAPIDVTFLAEEHEGLDVQEHADLRTLPDALDLPGTAALSGLLIPAERRIWVDAVEALRSPGRRRFTIAHELGHWRLHAAQHAAHTRFCRPDEIGASAVQLNGGPDLEREANRFAAALLMPEGLLRREAASCRFSIPALAKRFDVSAPAMQVRLEVLRLLPDYMRR